MGIDWEGLHRRRPKLLTGLSLMKRYRTKAGFVLAAICVAESIYLQEAPYDLHRPNLWAGLGLLLVASGLFFRVCALGGLRKKEQLATNGVYAVCRHPLYLGSILLAFGFCVLANCLVNYVAAIIYFALFYSLTIAWEESRLSERYGEAHRLYQAKTPLIMPLGRFAGAHFRWRSLTERNTVSLVATVMGLLIAVEVMAEVFK